MLKHIVDKHLFAMLGSDEFVTRWWDSPNAYFKLQRPIDLWISGEKGQKEVTDYVLHHAYAGGGS